MSRTHYCEDPTAQGSYGYDYTNQAWVKDGRYENCGHPEAMRCGCFARGHRGEAVQQGVEIH